MLKRTKNGELELTGFGTVRPQDPAARQLARSQKAEGHPLAGLCAQALGLPALEDRIGMVASRDSVGTRKALESHYEGFFKGLMVGGLATKFTAAVKAARELKASVAAPVLAQDVPPLMASFREKLRGVVADFAQTRLEPAKARLAAALEPEPIKDPAMASVAAIQAMEVRQRLASMPPADRIQAVERMGQGGMVDALHAVSSDPFGVAVAPEILKSAREKCLDAIGAGFLRDELEDAAEALQNLAAVGDLLEMGLEHGLRDVGCPEALLAKPPHESGMVQLASGYIDA